MTEKEKMQKQMLYDANYDLELLNERKRAKDLCHKYNQLYPSDEEGQQKIMKNLQEQIRLSLRRGVVAAQCSASQYIILLPQANYENSCMVCELIVKAFFHKYPLLIQPLVRL